MIKVRLELNIEIFIDKWFNYQVFLNGYYNACCYSLAEVEEMIKVRLEDAERVEELDERSTYKFIYIYKNIYIHVVPFHKLSKQTFLYVRKHVNICPVIDISVKFYCRDMMVYLM